METPLRPADVPGARLALALRDAVGEALFAAAGLAVSLLPALRRPPRAVGSVLHVSHASHKPYMLSRLMRDLGLRADYLALAGEKNRLATGARGYDYNVPDSLAVGLLRPFLVVWLLFAVMRRHDVIHVHFASLLTARGRELELLKRMGKILVFHFRGCDLRRRGANQAGHPDLNCCQECDYPPGVCDTAAQAERVALARRLADLLLVTTPDLRDFLPEAEHLPFIAPVGVDFPAIPAAPRAPGVFRVVTSSNHPGIDGLRHVREAVAQLQAEGRRVELVEMVRRPYLETLAAYKGADLYVGKLRMGYYTNAVIECLLLGVPCICHIREEYLRDIPDCPVLTARPEQVAERLRWCLDHPAELAAIAARGPDYVHRRHDPAAIGRQLLAGYARALHRRQGGTA